MKAFIQALVYTLGAFMVFGPAHPVLAQAPTLTVMVTPSDIPVPLTIVRGTLVRFQGTISEQMTETTVALRNDYGEFTRGNFLDSWKLTWNTRAERDPTVQVAVLWSRGGAAFSRLTRYNVRLVASPPFAIKSENAAGRLTVTISPTGTLTAQKYLVTLDGALTPLAIAGSGRGIIDTSLFSSGPHTFGATAVLTDGSTCVISPVAFFVAFHGAALPAARPSSRRPVPVPAKRKPARQGKARRQK